MEALSRPPAAVFITESPAPFGALVTLRSAAGVLVEVDHCEATDALTLRQILEVTDAS
jgi:hypothetical protein